MNLAAVSTLSTVALAGTWWRAIQTQHLAKPLATRHTHTIPGRFNLGTSSHPQPRSSTCRRHRGRQFEVGALLGSPIAGHSFVPNPLAVGWSFLPLTVNVQRIADLTSTAELAKLDTSVLELTGDWRGYGLRLPHRPPLAHPNWTNVPTQCLGIALEKSKAFEGMLTFSSRVSTKKNLVLFPTRLRKSSSVAYANPSTGATIQIP